MLEKLEQIEARYESLTEELSSPEVFSDPANYAKVSKQHRALGEIVEKYRQSKQLRSELAGAKELFDSSDDEEMRELAREAGWKTFGHRKFRFARQAIWLEDVTSG